MRQKAVLVLVIALAFPALAGCISALETPASTAAAAGFAPDCSIAPGAAIWPDPCTALSSFNPSPAKAEIDLAVNPTDPLNVVVASKDLDRRASECVWSVAQVTKDGGKTWKTVYIGGDVDGRVPELRAFACITDPIMVFDKEGVLYYALQAYRAGVGPSNIPSLPALGQPVAGSTFFLTRSKDGGETWDKYVLMHVGDGVGVFHDYPRMIVNPQTQAVHTIWNGVGQAGISPFVVTTRDGGESVDPPVSIVADDAPRGTDFDSGFAVTKDGVIYVTINKYPGADAFVGDAPSEKTVYIWTSTDDGRSFSEVAEAFSYVPTPRQLPNNKFRTPSFTEIAIDPSDGPLSGRMYAFYPDYGTGQSDVMSRYSDDGGKTWSEPVNVATETAGDQFMMRPEVGPDGTVHVLFYSRAWDSQNFLIDAVHAYSTDGGATWRNNRLTASSFDGDKGVHQNGFPFIGDYNGIRVGPDGAVWAAWGDTRTGVAEIAVARIAAPGAG